MPNNVSLQIPTSLHPHTRHHPPSVHGSVCILPHSLPNGPLTPSSSHCAIPIFPSTWLSRHSMPLCLFWIYRHHCILFPVSIISVICNRIGRWIVIQIHNVRRDGSPAHGCTASAGGHANRDMLFCGWGMPFYPHELLSILRVIHVFNLVASSQDRKCHGDGVVWTLCPPLTVTAVITSVSTRYS